MAFSPLILRKHRGEPFTDNWGCVWRNEIEGLEGPVVGHPLADWSTLAQWRAPDPLTMSERGPRDWTRARAEVEELKRAGRLTWGGAERLFDHLYFLRGFEPLMMDFATEPPDLDRLIGILGDYEHAM